MSQSAAVFFVTAYPPYRTLFLLPRPPHAACLAGRRSSSASRTPASGVFRCQQAVGPRAALLGPTVGARAAPPRLTRSRSQAVLAPQHTGRASARFSSRLKADGR